MAEEISPNFSKANATPSKEELLAELMDPSTTPERQEEIYILSKSFIDDEQPDSEQPRDKQYWIDKTNEQLAEMLLDPDVPGHIKDDISEYVILKARKQSFPSEE